MIVDLSDEEILEARMVCPDLLKASNWWPIGKTLRFLQCPTPLSALWTVGDCHYAQFYEHNQKDYVIRFKNGQMIWVKVEDVYLLNLPFVIYDPGAICIRLQDGRII